MSYQMIHYELFRSIQIFEIYICPFTILNNLCNTNKFELLSNLKCLKTYVIYLGSTLIKLLKRMSQNIR